ncbi:MAG: PP2C family protein-serine/threonine phosphatase [Bacteroidetes bacterium]|nr:PP2C family protein-serine/threonine phosphatase [Bacteroidota bacterium]
MAKERHSLPSPFRFSGMDLAILLLGLAGLIAWGSLLGNQHPDSTAEYEISEEEAYNQANLFLAGQGYNMDGLSHTVDLRRKVDLLTSLQETLGRPTTVEFLASSQRNVVSAYYWQVAYHPSRQESGGSLNNSEEPVFEVQLAQDGKVLALRNNTLKMGAAAQQYGSASERVNRTALSFILRADSSSDSEARTALSAISDSMFHSNVRFSLDAGWTVGPEEKLNQLLNGGSVTLDSTSILTLFDHLLSRTAYANTDLKLDSLSVATSLRNPSARIKMITEPPIAGHVVVLEAGLSPTGTLARLNVSYKPTQEKTSSLASVLSGVNIGLMGLLGFVFMVVFFRRLIARLLDMKSALVDAMLLGIMAGLLVSLSTNALSDLVSGLPVWGDVLVRLILFSVVAGAVSIFAFMVAGVTDSVVREAYEGKLGTLLLLRHGDFQNKPMGSSLVRGMSLGGILLGIAVVALRFSDTLYLTLEEGFLIDGSFRPVLSSVFAGFEKSYFLTLLWIVGIGSLAHKMKNGSVLPILLLTVTGAFVGAGPAPTEPGLAALILGAASAFVLAWAFMRFDIITVMAAIFSSEVLWYISEGFLVDGSGAWIDLLLGGLFLGSILLLGFSGVSSKRTGQQVNNYVPEYVSEMAGQERVKRELEIAHQVQSFFLPRRMPDIQGLDIAGMCLSANEVGGDYYDFIELDDGRLAFVLGDVSGKGIQAAFFMTLVKGIVQTLARQQLSPAEIMRRLNHLFCQNAPAGTFISVVYGEIDPKARSFTFARAGHNPVIWFDADQKTSTALRPKGMAIGFTDGPAFDDSIEESTISLAEGDTLVFYTDGFSEAMNRARDLYGDDRLVDKVTQIGGRSSSAILRMMTEDVHHFIEGMGRADDMTMAVIKLI